MVVGLYDIVNDEVVGANLLMASVVVAIIPMIIRFTQPLQASLARFPSASRACQRSSGRFVRVNPDDPLRPRVRTAGHVHLPLGVSGRWQAYRLFSSALSLWVTNASFSVIRRTSGRACDSARSTVERTPAATELESAMLRKIIALAFWTSSEAARCSRS